MLGKRGGLSLENGKVTRPVSIRRGEMLSCTKVVRSANRVVASILSEKNGSDRIVKHDLSRKRQSKSVP